jgi:hypothetical protein
VIGIKKNIILEKLKMYLYLETKEGSNRFMCKGEMTSPADDPKGFARKMNKEGLRVAQHPDEMGKNPDESTSRQPCPCYQPIPLDDVIDHIVSV